MAGIPWRRSASDASAGAATRGPREMTWVIRSAMWARVVGLLRHCLRFWS
jgi:hypothetical protein